MQGLLDVWDAAGVAGKRTWYALAFLPGMGLVSEDDFNKIALWRCPLYCINKVLEEDVGGLAVVTSEESENKNKKLECNIARANAHERLMKMQRELRDLSAWLETETQFRANLVLEGLALIAAER